jgi:hypothetical protein
VQTAVPARLYAALLIAMTGTGAWAAGPTEVSVADAPCYCPAPAVDSSAAWVLPPVYEAGAVRYRTGGVGRTEAEAMRADGQHYPLALQFLVRDGQSFQYTSRVTVEIAGARGEKLLGVTSDGPFLLADVPPGHYHITAISDDGRPQTREVDVVSNAHKDLQFVWVAP